MEDFMSKALVSYLQHSNKMSKKKKEKKGEKKKHKKENHKRIEQNSILSKQGNNKKGWFEIKKVQKFLSEVNISAEKLNSPSLLEVEKKQMRGLVREFMGTQQPIIRFRTGVTTLTTSGANLTQVVAMDVTGIASWSSFAAIFDEYRVRKARLKVTQQYIGYGASATTLAAMPVINVIDYDDSTALASISQAMQYDTHKIMNLGSSVAPVHKSKWALPEGQPDLAWVTTSSPSVPFWWKFWSITTLVPSTASMANCWIEGEIEFRQTA